jgi:hypothetical protein
VRIARRAGLRSQRVDEGHPSMMWTRPAGMSRTAAGIPVKLAVTVALVYAQHFTTNVVRETYLAVALGEDFSIRVDRFMGLHPDLFEMPGRGAFINNNPGASMLGAVPYGIVHPALEVLYRLRPSLVAPKPPTTYDDPRPNRTLFMNQMRARGMDVRLALGAIIIQLGINVPLGALAAAIVFLFLRRRLDDEPAALRLALLFALGTPVFFRSAFLNQNLLLAYCTMFATLALLWTSDDKSRPHPESRHIVRAGLLLGFGVLCDYSGAPILLVFALWVACIAAVNEGPRHGLTATGWLVLGAAGPIAVLWLYQYAAFGNPFLPAQTYMPRTELSGEGWNGIGLPRADLLWLNLFSPRYGLFVFCPMLAAAVLAPRYSRSKGGLGGAELALIFAASGALYLFSSSIAYAELQFNTGIRYLVPAVPLLFFALVPVLLNGPRWMAWMLVAPTLVISFAVSMTRESVPIALTRLFTNGPELPWYTVLQKTGFVYAPALPSEGLPLVVFFISSAMLWLVWRTKPSRHASIRSSARQ